MPSCSLLEAPLRVLRATAGSSSGSGRGGWSVTRDARAIGNSNLKVVLRASEKKNFLEPEYRLLNLKPEGRRVAALPAHAQAGCSLRQGRR